MTLIIADRVKETTATTGTGALTLAGAMTGFRTFASMMATNDTCWYCLQGVDSASSPTGEWEVGLGTYSGTNTLTRTTVYASSNSGSAVNLSAGTKQVFITLPATKHLAPFGTFDTAPVISQFSWVNQGSCTINQVDGGMTLFAPYSGSDSLRMRMIATPSTPYQVIARLTVMPFAGAYMSGGLIWRDSASGKLQTFGMLHSSTFNLIVQNYNSATSYNSDQVSPVQLCTVPIWYRVTDDGTNRKCYVSADGSSWSLYASFSRTSFLTPDQVGFYCNTNSLSRDMMITIHSWYAGA